MQQIKFDDFGRRLRACRGALDLSQGELAKRLTEAGYKYTASSVSNYEKGKSSEPSLTLINKLVEVTGYDASYWLGLSDEINFKLNLK